MNQSAAREARETALLAQRASAAEPYAENPGSKGNGSFTVGPEYKIDPDLTDIAGYSMGGGQTIRIGLAKSSVSDLVDRNARKGQRPKHHDSDPLSETVGRGSLRKSGWLAGHGAVPFVGSGKLRDEIHEILRLKKEVKSFVNQYDSRYGYGATEIFFQY
jgi:hypothetical protein